MQGHWVREPTNYRLVENNQTLPSYSLVYKYGDGGGPSQEEVSELFKLVVDTTAGTETMRARRTKGRGIESDVTGVPTRL